MNARSNIATLGVVNCILRGNKNKRKTEELLSYFTVLRKKSLSSKVLRGGEPGASGT